MESLEINFTAFKITDEHCLGPPFAFLLSNPVVSYQHAGCGTVQRDSDEPASAGGSRGVREILRQSKKYHSAHLHPSLIILGLVEVQIFLTSHN
jgi:hypothetical protein